jgi:hypothetical protein
MKYKLILTVIFALSIIGAHIVDSLFLIGVSLFGIFSTHFLEDE